MIIDLEFLKIKFVLFIEDIFYILSFGWFNNLLNYGFIKYYLLKNLLVFIFILNWKIGVYICNN